MLSANGSSSFVISVDAGENHGNTASSSVHQLVKPRWQSAFCRQALARMNSPTEVINILVKKNTEDEKFAELMCTRLEDKPEYYEKANLRMTFQSEIKKVKYKANNQVALQVPSPMSSY